MPTLQTIGILGDFSWEVTAKYVELFQKEVQKRVREIHSAPLMVFMPWVGNVSIPTKTLEQMEFAEQVWCRLEEMSTAGAQRCLIASNTLHFLIDRLTKFYTSPHLIHIVDVVIEEVKARGMKHVGLLGTKATMEGEFYQKRCHKHGIKISLPTDAERHTLDSMLQTTYEELTAHDVDRKYVHKCIESLAAQGVDAVILASGKLCLLFPTWVPTPVPLLRTMHLHVQAAVRFALGEENNAPSANTAT